MDKVQKIVKLPKPLQYQQEIIDYLEQPDVKYVTFLKSRQSGGSFLNKILVLKWALESTNSKILFVTPTLKLGKLFYKELVESSKSFIKTENGTELRIDFVTGSYCQFLSAESENSLRGFQATHLILDEAAYINDNVWNLILRPMTLIKGKKVVMCSTPNGTDNFFYNHVVYGYEKRPGYITKKITIYDNPFVTEEQISEIKQQIPERIFQQEYLAEFLDGSGSVFVKFKDCLIKNKLKSTKFFAGIDIGRSNDYTVCTIMNEYKQIVDRYRVTNLEYTLQVKQITEILNKYKPIVTILELNNAGQVVYELLKKEYRGNLKGVTLDNSFKKEMIENLVVAFEQNKIEIDNDENLLRELAGLYVTVNPEIGRASCRERV